jgi:hypothetical protein
VLNLSLELDRRIGLWETGAMPRIFEAGIRAAQARVAEIRGLLSAPRGPRFREVVPLAQAEA